MSEPFEPIQRRDPFAGINDGGQKPSIEGRDTLAWAMAELVPKRKPPKPKKWWHWWVKHPKRLALFLVADLVLAHFAWGYLFKANPGAAKQAVLSTLSDASHNDWSAVYDSLCKSDRAQVDPSDLATAGHLAMTQLGLGLDHATITSITPVKQSLGPIGEPEAAQVAGQLFPVVGAPSDYKVVVVHEIPGGWHLCMSAGGFSMLGYTEPLGSRFTP